MEKRLYAIMTPNSALVGSMLPPHAFGSHYTIGSSRYFHGQVIFAEIDPNYRHPYFPIDKYLAEVKPKADGSPKRTKFISCYRVLEHLDFSAFRGLYVTTVDGRTLELKAEPYQRKHKAGFIRTFQEINPLSAVILARMTPPEFAVYITDPNQPKSAPKVLFTQIDLDIDKFLQQIEANPFHASPLPNVHAHKLRDQILEMKDDPEKPIKGITLDSVLNRLSFLRLRNGFWFAHGQELLYYRIPTENELKQDNAEWYRALNRHD